MATHCVGCGNNISESKVFVYSDASHHVMPLWSKLFDKYGKDVISRYKTDNISFCLLLTKTKDKTMEYQAASIFSLHTVVAIIKWK